MNVQSSNSGNESCPHQRTKPTARHVCSPPSNDASQSQLVPFLRLIQATRLKDNTLMYLTVSSFVHYPLDIGTFIYIVDPTAGPEDAHT